MRKIKENAGIITLSGILLMLVVYLTFSILLGPSHMTMDELNQALLAGDNVEGQSVEFEVYSVTPNEVIGYEVEGEYEGIVFVSSTNPEVESGDTMKATIEKQGSVFGTWILTYEK